jgi:hypothetical protein
VVEGVVGALVLFLEQRRQVAGRLWSTASFGENFNPSLCCEIRGTGDIRRCARVRVERRGPEGGRGVLNRAGIGDEQWQNQWAPARNLHGLAALLRRGKEGDGIGAREGFIGRVFMALTRAG